jgi:hypothetical protein
MNTVLQDKARKLYFQADLTKTDIANALGMPRRTLHYWIKEQNWEYQKQCASHMPVLIAENCYHLLANYTQQLLAPERKDVMITNREVDALHKLTVTISKLKGRTTLNENMEVFSNFINSVNNTSPDMAQAIAPFIHDFIASRAAASASVPLHFQSPITPEEIETERQLDLQYAAEEEAEAEANMQTATTPITRPPLCLDGEKQEATRLRRSHPDYSDLLTDFRRQDEHIRHMFPVNTRYAHSAAA